MTDDELEVKALIDLDSGAYGLIDEVGAEVDPDALVAAIVDAGAEVVPYVQEILDRYAADLQDPLVSAFVPEQIVGVWGVERLAAGEWASDDWHDDYVGAPTDGRAWLDGDPRGVARGFLPFDVDQDERELALALSMQPRAGRAERRRRPDAPDGAPRLRPAGSAVIGERVDDPTEADYARAAITAFEAADDRLAIEQFAAAITFDPASAEYLALCSTERRVTTDSCGAHGPANCS